MTARLSHRTRTLRSIRLGAGFALAVAGGVVFVPSSPVSAGSFVVATAAELRSAVDDINDGSAGAGPHTITLDNAGPFEFACGTSEDDNLDGDLDIDTTDPVTITYAGPGHATISIEPACQVERVIDVVAAGDLTLERILVTGGDLTNAPATFFGDAGGGIAARTTGATIRLIESNVIGNRAADGIPSSTSGGLGGGIFVRSGTLELVDSTVADNRAGDGAPRTPTTLPGEGGRGGGIAVLGTAVTLTNSTIEANRAGDGGAGSADGAPGRGGFGGGIYAVSTSALTVNGGAIGGSALAGNRAGNAGLVNGWAGSLGTAAGGDGGGFWTNFTDVTLTNTQLSYNEAGTGATSPDARGGTGGDGGGAEINGGAVIVSDSTIQHNHAGAGGDGEAAEPTPGGGTGGSAGGLSVVGSSATLTMTGTMVSDNVAGAGGASVTSYGGMGGLAGGLSYRGPSVTIETSTFENNVSGAGGTSTNSFGGISGSAGGIRIGNFTTTMPNGTISDTIIRGNTIGAPGSGSSPGGAGNGAGLVVSSVDAVVVERTTITANAGARDGGGVYASGGSFVNSTIDGNDAVQGGGLFSNTGSVEIIASTVSDNTATFGASVGTLSGTVTLERTALVGPRSNHCYIQSDGSIVAGADNLEEGLGGASGSCADSSVSDVAQVGPLDDHGGPTPTRLPLVTSALVDAIAAGDCVEATDQRGIARPQGTGCDIGAAELALTVEAVDDDAAGLADELEVDVIANDVSGDVPLDPMSVVVTSGPANGSTSVDGGTGVVTYTPTGTFGGVDSFTYEVCVTGAPAVCDSAVATVNITRPDAQPDGFGFVDVVDVAVSSVQVSNAVTVSGTNVESPISVAGGEYSVNGGAFTAAAGTVQPGDTVRVRHTSASDPLTSVDTVLTVGGVSDTFTSTTAAPDVEPAPEGATRFVPLPPVRLFDTRDGLGLDAAGKLLPGQTIDVAVAGNAGVPAGAAAVVINLTVAESDGPGFVTAFPRGVARPDASTLNTTAAGQFRPNLATVPLDADGFMSVFALMGTHLIGDVAGYYEATDVAVASGRVVSLAPTRVFDSRPGEAANGPKGFINADSSVSVQVAGEGGVPEAGVSAVVMNVTATASAGPNFVTVWPTGSDRPDASSLNLGLGETTANLVMVPLGDDGKVDFYTLAGAHLLADVTGYVTDDTADADTAGLFVPLTPARVFDTRVGEPAAGPKGFVVADSSITTQTTGAAGVPDDAAAVVLNVTATQAPLGFITVWPTGVAFPTASTLNLQGVNDTRANAAIMPVGDGGRIDYYAISGAHLIADTTGYYLN